MRLFEIDDDTTEVKLNKPWIYLIPEFDALLKRDKGSAGDYDGRRKLKARKEFTFIYFYVDFASPLRDYEDSEKRKEALHYARLTEDDIDAVVETALEKYRELFFKAARALRTYNALQKALDAMDEYFENLDMQATDKKGELLNDPVKVAGTVSKLDSMYVAINNFAKRVEEELSQGPTTIRGTASLGDKEGKNKDVWSESEIAENSVRVAGGEAKSGGSFMNLQHLIKSK